MDTKDLSKIAFKKQGGDLVYIARSVPELFQLHKAFKQEGHSTMCCEVPHQRRLGFLVVGEPPRRVLISLTALQRSLVNDHDLLLALGFNPTLIDRNIRDFSGRKSLFS